MKTHHEFPNIAEGATTADLYNRAIEIGASGDSRLARRYFQALLEHVMEYSVIPNMTQQKAEGVVFTNIEYWIKHHDVDAKAILDMYGRILGTFRSYSFDEMWHMFMMGRVTQKTTDQTGINFSHEDLFEVYMAKLALPEFADDLLIDVYFKLKSKTPNEKTDTNQQNTGNQGSDSSKSAVPVL